jgi:NADH-quinone oxidoreductase subunit N
MNYLQLGKLAAPEVALVVAALAVLAISLANERARGTCLFVALLGVAAAAGSFLFLPAHANPFGSTLVLSPLNRLFEIICLALAFAALLLTHAEHALPHRGEYIAIILFATVGLLLLVSGEELLTIFIGLELLGLSLYVMTGFDKSSVHSAEAGLKYFLFGSTASAFTLFGISLIYGITGSTELSRIAAGLNGTAPLLAAGVVMTLVGLAFKIAAAPFHLWAPDVYEAAPVTSGAFIASASKVASFVVLGKIVLIAFAPVHGSAAWHGMTGGWSPLLAILAAFSILLGNFVALAQRDVRRLLAYSAVAHAGYSLLGLIAGNRDGLSATLFYITLYAVTLLGAFGVCSAVRHETGGTQLVNFAGLGQRAPLLSGCMAVFMLSLAGLPPLAGFFGKFYLFSSALRAAPDFGLAWLVAIALFGSLISLYYYLLVLKAIFIDQPSGSTARPLDVSADFLRSATVLVLALAVVLFGITPSPLLEKIIGALA